MQNTLPVETAPRLQLTALPEQSSVQHGRIKGSSQCHLRRPSTADRIWKRTSYHFSAPAPKLYTPQKNNNSTIITQHKRRGNNYTV